MTVPVTRHPNIESGLQDQTNIVLNLFNTILDTANTCVELNHSWAAIERDISAQECLEARHSLEISNNLLVSSVCSSFMSLDSRVSRRRRGLSP
jgi:hypothetical protein